MIKSHQEFNNDYNEHFRSIYGSHHSASSSQHEHCNSPEILTAHLTQISNKPQKSYVHTVS